MGMDTDFLKDFPHRMKSVGRYAILMKNSFQKDTWKQYGIETIDAQMNLIFSVLLYLMEYSLREENCTVDDIAQFIGAISEHYYKRSYSYEKRKTLADFLVNVILSNSGNPMYFKGYDYEKLEYREIPIRYIGNKVVYLDGGMRRTSYYLTEEGYNMVLSTMELENNLKLTVHEMLFKLHLEKADYGRAVNDIKNVFDQLRIQVQKIEEAMRQIRQNALAYSVEEYREIIKQNIDTIEDTRQKFKVHREMVELRVKGFEEQEIHVKRLNRQEQGNLEQLRVIESYLNRALDEHQRILNIHFDLKSLYDMELENYSNMTMVQRYHFRSELYDKVLEDSGLLLHMDEFFKPLFQKRIEKRYHPGLACEEQRRIRKAELEEEREELGFSEAEYEEERRRKAKERLEKYVVCLTLLVTTVAERGKISLAELERGVFREKKEVLIPSVEIFREIIIELLTVGGFHIGELRKERGEYLLEAEETFQIHEMLVGIVEEQGLEWIQWFYAARTELGERVRFEGVWSESGEYKNVWCSNVEFWYR